MVVYIIMAIIAYLIGSINFSVILSKKWLDLMLEKKEVEMQEALICFVQLEKGSSDNTYLRYIKRSSIYRNCYFIRKCNRKYE